MKDLNKVFSLLFEKEVENLVHDAKEHSKSYEEAILWLQNNAKVSNEPNKTELENKVEMFVRNFNRSVYYEASDSLNNEALELPIKKGF